MTAFNFHILLILFNAWLTYSNCQVGSLDVDNIDIQCVESERVALLHFKQSISVDYCGLLDDWGHSQECCQWRGIHCNNQSGHVISLKLCGYVSGNSGYEPCLEGTLSTSLLDLKYLKYLDLSVNNFQGQIPKLIGSLDNLEYLNLSNVGFGGVIPQEIGNLSKLISLDLNVEYNNLNLRVDSLGWLSRLRLLRVLDLSGVDLSVATHTWLTIVNNLPFLRKLHLDGCELSLSSPSSLSYTNSSTTLDVLSLSNNNFTDTSIFEWLLNLNGLETNLLYLDLSYNEMFGDDLELSEHAMKRLDNLCRLQILDLSSTNFNYKFSNIVQSFSACSRKPLVSLQLSQNQVWGLIPANIGTFSSLRELEVGDNRLNGTIPQAIGELTMLESLDLSSNSLSGTLTSVHLSNLSKLQELRLSDNTEVVVNVHSSWIPPFQLDTVGLRSCKVGPNFPRWLLTQTNLLWIDISNASISDTIPVTFWKSLGSGFHLDMSLNMIYGTLPDVPIIFDSLCKIDLSFNNLEGSIPSFLGSNVSILYLNNNKFSKGLDSFLCQQIQRPLMYLDLSNNFFSEKFPDCWSYFDQLVALHLENNNIWGNLPTSMGALHLGVLHLSNNNLSGEIPTSLLNCKSLVILDLSNNSLIGHIPPSFGHSLPNLGILSLQNNRFVGGLPTSICDLSKLQLLDLSRNSISGMIPRCFHKLASMANTNKLLQDSDIALAYYLNSVGVDDTRVTWKREEHTFGGGYSFRLLKGIDISSNKLEGQIPEDISSLLGLKFLNLSRNNLSGSIMSGIGQLASLESLDLSHNHLSGEIPPSLAQISFLTILDVSDNNLTGEIPVGTQLQGFDVSSYMGNPGLCGAPLPKCVEDETSTTNEDVEQGTKDVLVLGLCISVILGFIVGFWGVCGTLVLKRSWRHAFFRFYEDTKARCLS